MQKLNSQLKKLFFVFGLIACTIYCSLGSQSLVINVDIFLEEQNSDLTQIVQNAMQRFMNDHKNSSDLSFKLIRYNRMISDILSLDQVMGLNYNQSSSLHVAIFVHISSHELVLASILENSDILSVGLFQTNGMSRTQENPAAFTRVASPSMIHYACTIRDLIQKMGWRTLSFVLSADLEGRVLSDALLISSRELKWNILHTAWLSGNKNVTELQSYIKRVMSNLSDAVIVHVRDSYNDDLFRIVQAQGVSHLKASWVLTDIAALGVSDNEVLPTGFIRISPWKSPQHDFMEDALYDVFQLITKSVTSTVAKTAEGDTSVEQSAQKTPTEFQTVKEMKKKLKDTFFPGKSSLFEDPELSKGPFATMGIFNLQEDVYGSKHWVSVGLRTYSGMALETFYAPNGYHVSPSVTVPRPIVRVPVVSYPSWVEAEMPQDTSESTILCMKRGYMCWNKTDTGVVQLCCFGFSIDLLRSLERQLGFVPEIYLVSDGQYGIIDEETGKWNGVMNELVSGRGDLALDLVMTETRLKEISYSIPYLPLALNILVKKDGPLKNGNALHSWLQPFSVYLWVAILGTCNLILMVVWWLDRKSPSGHHRIFKESDENGFTMLDAMSYVWGVAFSKDIGAERTPRSISARCVSTVYASMALILANTYCANMMAFLVEDHYTLPIDGITDPKLVDTSFYPPAGFQLGILKDSYSEAYFRNHINDDIRQLYETNIKNNLLKNLTEGINRLENGEINGFVDDYLSLRKANNKIANCHFGLAGPTFYTSGLAFAMPKNSPWLEEINKVVFDMKQNGTIDLLEKMHFDEKMCSSSIAKELSVLNLSGLFLALAVTIGFCFLALLIEVLAIFLLVRFRHHLGALGKFSVRLLFDIEKGEEHLIMLQYSSEKKRKCVQLDVVKMNAATHKSQRDSVNTVTSLGTPQLERGFEAAERKTRQLANGSFVSNLTSDSMLMPFTNDGFYGDNLTSTVTPL